MNGQIYLSNIVLQESLRNLQCGYDVRKVRAMS